MPESEATTTPARTEREFDPLNHCGAKLESGRRCKNPKGFRVPGRNGHGPCHLHGGTGAKSLQTHGIYSKLDSPRLEHLLKRIKNTGHDVLDLEPEANLIRALTIDYVERHQALTDALILWHQTARTNLQDLRDAMADKDTRRIVELLPAIASIDQTKPPKTPDISEAAKLIDRIGRTVERIHRIRSDRSISDIQLQAIFAAQTAILVKHLDRAMLRQILDDYDRISWT